jgi:hypothetical protein
MIKCVVAVGVLLIVASLMSAARAHFKGSCEDNLQFMTLAWGMCDQYDLQADDDQNDQNSQNSQGGQYKHCHAWTNHKFWEVRRTECVCL